MDMLEASGVKSLRKLGDSDREGEAFLNVSLP